MKNLRRAVSDVLVTRGFHRDDRAHLLRVNDEFSIAVDTGPLNKKPDIAPYVGIRHEPTERLFSDLIGLPQDDRSATVAANVGYILGKGYMYWNPPTDSAEVVTAIDDSIVRLRPYMSLEKLPQVWDLTGVRDPVSPYREIVMMLLRGEHDRVPKRLEVHRAEFCKQQDEVCEQFEGFATNVRSYLEKATSDQSRR